MYSIMEEDRYEYQDIDLPGRPCLCPQVEYNNKPDSLFFNDGVRRIDFILVYDNEDKRHILRKVGFSVPTCMFYLL